MLAILSLMPATLLLSVVLWSDLFVRTFPPATEGRDLNPVLQHPGLTFHPPLLYLGYGGLMIAANVVLASLLCGEFDSARVRICWHWALPNWGTLTAGIVLGFWWAYCGLGWGGQWLWDPVENTSLLPWLSAIALLHSLSLTRQRGAFYHWSLLLVVVTLILSLLGTSTVHSGIPVSAHAFTLDNAHAVLLFSLFILISLASLTLYGWRMRDGGPTVYFSGLSWEMLTLATPLLLCTILLIVLMRIFYPIIYGLLGWGHLSVGVSYFNRAALLLGLLMLVVIVLATLVSGKRVQLPALVAHAGVSLLAAGAVVSSVNRQEISLSLQPGQRATLAGHTFRFECPDL